MPTNPVSSYAKSMYTKFKRYAAWPPGQRIKLGDIGVIRDNVFELKKNLRNLGFKFKVRTGEPTDWEHKSGKSVSLTFKAAGESFEVPPMPLKQAGARIAFSGAGAFIFQAVGCVESQIENTDALGKQILKWIKSKDWKAEWVVVDALMITDRAVVMVSDSDQAEVDLSAKGDLGTGGVSLATASSGLTVTREVGSVTKVIGKNKGLTPMFAVSRVKRTIWDLLTGGEGTLSRAAKEVAPKKSAKGKRTSSKKPVKKSAKKPVKIDPAKVLERVKRK
ncbi:MAG: hypothetical protein K8R36_16615 [Planctomycetales bacterium]|nr:hypothetical protein [Planctomycetales bacterium]